MPTGDDLRQAIEREDLEYVRLLVKMDRVIVNSRESKSVLPSGTAALHIAAQRGNLEIIQFLLESGADVNVRDIWGYTPLDHALQWKSGLRVAQLLLDDDKADLNATDSFGQPTLHRALLFGANLEAIQLLISYMENVRATNRDGRTALHSALKAGSDLDVVQLLVADYKLDINATDEVGSTPMHLIGNKGVSAPVMELLLAHHADFLAKDQNLETPLHWLARSSSIEAITVLFDQLRATKGPVVIDAALMCVDKVYGYIPLCRVNNVDMARLLLEQPLSENDPLGPRVSYEMLRVKDARGVSFIDARHDGYGPLRDYVRSYADFPLTVAGSSTSPPPTSCAHRNKRQRHDGGVGVRTNPMLNNFQRAIAEGFLNKWNGWSTLFEQQDGNSSDSLSDGEDSQYDTVLPIELKRATMGYLSLVDIMQLKRS